MESLFDILNLLLRIATYLIFAHFIMSWLLAFNVLNPRQQFVQQVWMGLSRLLEPLYRPIRNILPPMGGLDLAPLVVLILIQILQIVLRNNAGAFG
jgi:YggT family protein